MRYVISLVITLFLSTSIVISAINLDYAHLQDKIGKYNNNIEKVPPVLKSLLGNEKVNVVIHLNNGSILEWNFETQNAKIVDFAQGSLNNPTIEARAMEDALDSVMNSKDPISDYHKAEKVGQIRIEGKTLPSKLKIMAVLSNEEAIKPFLSSLNLIGPNRD